MLSGRKMPPGPFPVGAAFLVGIAFLVGTANAAGPDTSFREGIRAGDLKKWSLAAEKMREAIAGNPQESKKRVTLSGVFSAPYLPHFYHGWFLFQQGQDRCEQALEAWAISEEQGVISSFKKQHEDLVRGREICNARVLPAAAEAARGEINRAERLLEDLRGVEDAALAGERRQVRQTLEQARAQLESESSQLESIRAAQSQAAAASERLLELRSRASGQATDRLSTAVAEAERELERAERARQALAAALRGADPAIRIPAGAPTPTAAKSRLEAARQALAASRRGADLSGVRQVREDAERLRNALEDAQRRAAATAAREATAEPGPEDLPGADAPTAVDPSPPSPPAPAPLPSQPSATGADTNEPVLLEEIRRLTNSAERFLDRIALQGQGLADSDSEFFTLQKSRLAELILEARQQGPGVSSKALERLLRRLEDSLTALQLIAGAQAYFAGNPQQAVEMLLTGDPPDGPLAAQFHLFLSAARFALFQIDILEDTELAAVDARRCQDLDPRLMPDERAFSPRFREFFEASRDQNR